MSWEAVPKGRQKAKASDSQTVAVAPEKAPEANKPISAKTLVESAFREKIGLNRKVLPLWGTYFRVNYHDPAKANFIVESHFVQVVDGEVKEMF